VISRSFAPLSLRGQSQFPRNGVNGVIGNFEANLPITSLLGKFGSILMQAPVWRIGLRTLDQNRRKLPRTLGSICLVTAAGVLSPSYGPIKSMEKVRPRRPK